MPKLGAVESTRHRLFLIAEWRDLVMLNYIVPPTLLEPYVPKGTELDDWNGKLFVSVVGFRFLKTRIMGMPIPFHCNFDEVNLRFYVRHRAGNEWRRGVIFVREIVPRRAIAIIANAFYNEKYCAMPMIHKIERQGIRIDAQYQWMSKGNTRKLELTANGEAVIPASDSAAHFITEHFWGYAGQRDGGCIEYRVEHPSWNVWNAERAMLEGDMAQVYGPQMAEVLRRKPDSAFLAEGSAVKLYRGIRIN